MAGLGSHNFRDSQEDGYLACDANVLIEECLFRSAELQPVCALDHHSEYLVRILFIHMHECGLAFAAGNEVDADDPSAEGCLLTYVVLRLCGGYEISLRANADAAASQSMTSASALRVRMDSWLPQHPASHLERPTKTRILLHRRFGTPTLIFTTEVLAAQNGRELPAACNVGWPITNFDLVYVPRKAARSAAPFGLPRPVHASQPDPAE